MSQFHDVNPVITILSGQTDSDPVVMNEQLADSESFAVLSPAALPETCTIQGSVDFDVNYRDNNKTLAQAAAAATWAAVTPTLGAAGAQSVIQTNLLPYTAIRIHAAVAVAADRIFKVSKRHITY